MYIYIYLVFCSKLLEVSKYCFGVWRKHETCSILGTDEGVKPRHENQNECQNADTIAGTISDDVIDDVIGILH